MTHPNALATLATRPAAASPKTGEHAGRVRVLTEIAERYDELVTPGARNGEPGSGEHSGRMPRTYTPTVREFERLYRLMRYDRSESLVDVEKRGKVSVRRLAWHLNAYHLDAKRVIRHRPRKSKKGATLLEHDGRVSTVPQLEHVRHPSADKLLAEAAIVWMAARWGLVTEPMLPDELRIAA